MKVHLCNKSGISISHSRSLKRINTRVSRRPAYSTGEKLKILRVIKKMVEEDALTYSEASSALGLDNSMISPIPSTRARRRSASVPYSTSNHWCSSTNSS